MILAMEGRIIITIAAFGGGTIIRYPSPVSQHFHLNG